jgi:hypothetical protein
MSETDESPVVERLRTVTPGSRGHSDPEMDTIGLGIALGILILLVPLLPFFLIGYVFVKLLEFVRRQAA